MPSTPPRTGSLLKEVERKPAEDDVDGESGVDDENENSRENDRMENALAVNWFGGMTRWASKLWTTKRAERLNTPHTRE